MRFGEEALCRKFWKSKNGKNFESIFPEIEIRIKQIFHKCTQMQNLFAYLLKYYSLKVRLIFKLLSEKMDVIIMYICEK
jgi:hypothetical protein